jgi:hypothetical protein
MLHNSSIAFNFKQQKVTTTNYKHLTDICSILLLPLAIMTTINVPPSFSSQGSAPKLEYFKALDETTTGPQIYNEADSKIIRDKLEAISKSFDKMLNKIENAINKNNKNNAKNAMELVMNDLKINMRQVARVATDGDIYIRRNTEAEANFDYNSGKFEYKQEAQLVEDIVAKLNQLYFYGLNSNPDETMKELIDIKNTYNNWFQLVQSKIVKPIG